MPRIRRRDITDPVELERLRAQARATAKKWRLANLERCRAVGREKARRRNARGKYKLRARDLLLRRKYGITLAEYEAMFAAQAGLCAICRRSQSGMIYPRGTKRLAVDHCHVSGRVRGLLCGYCNVMIGHAREVPGILRIAAEYLDKHAVLAAQSVHK
jgi:hypothetical protein